MEIIYIRPSIGQRIICDDPENLPSLVGRECTVLNVDGSEIPILAEFDGGITKWFKGWGPLPGAETGIITDLQAQVASKDAALTQANAETARLRDRVREWQRQYDHDMTWLDNYFKDTLKPEMDWCDTGYNERIELANNNITGGFQFTLARRLVRKDVSVRGETTANLEVWVYDDAEESDSDNWMDEEGNSLDADDAMQERLLDEMAQCQGRFDTVEVA